MFPNSEKKSIPVHSFTRSHSGLARQIITPVTAKNIYTGAKFDTTGIWDTGATGSVITKELAQKLGLIPSGPGIVRGVHGVKTVNVYPLRIIFNHKLNFTIPVTECERLADDDSCHLLIGMDIISQGDFVITNFQGNTTMTFRSPSLERVDFVEEMNAKATPKPPYYPKFAKQPNRNDPCHCGSGKKYKNCHGKN